MKQLSRYRGCLLAGAAGDALGYQVEFDRLSDILEEHGENGVRRMGRQISDDTQMTLFTAEGLVNGFLYHRPMPDCVYQAYLDWYHTQSPNHPGGSMHRWSKLCRNPGMFRRRAPGMTCLNALSSGRMGTMKEAINNSKGCGGVMRTAPCGMLRLIETPDPGDAWAMQGAMAAAITHGHKLGYIPAAMLSDIVHMICLEDGHALEEIILESLKRANRLFGEDELLNRLMQRAVELAQTDVPARKAIAELGEGWVGEEALAIAVYCALRYQDNMEECLSAAVTHNGDSDSTGAVAGNILGAWLGEEAIPAHWLEKLELRETIEEAADMLYGASLCVY